MVLPVTILHVRLWKACSWSFTSVVCKTNQKHYIQLQWLINRFADDKNFVGCTALWQKRVMLSVNCVCIYIYIGGTGWTVRGLNPCGGEIFRTRTGLPWGSHRLLYNGYRVSVPGVKQPVRGVNHPPPSSAEVKERVELYLYSTSGPSEPVLGSSLFLPCIYLCIFTRRPVYIQGGSNMTGTDCV